MTVWVWSACSCKTSALHCCVLGGEHKRAVLVPPLLPPMRCPSAVILSSVPRVLPVPKLAVWAVWRWNNLLIGRKWTWNELKNVTICLIFLKKIMSACVFTNQLWFLLFYCFAAARQFCRKFCLTLKHKKAATWQVFADQQFIAHCSSEKNVFILWYQHVLTFNISTFFSDIINYSERLHDIWHLLQKVWCG